MFPDLDYARLKRSCQYFVEHYASAEFDAGSHPLKLLQQDELLRTNGDKQALVVAIADFVDGTQDFAVNVSRKLIGTYRSETLTRYPFCVSTSQAYVIRFNRPTKPTLLITPAK